MIKIPFRPTNARGWCIRIPGDGERHFLSRARAMAFALTLVKQRGADPPAQLSIEGADGRWRRFTPDLLPVA